MELGFVLIRTNGSLRDISVLGSSIFIGSPGARLQIGCDDEEEANDLADLLADFYEKRRKAAEPDRILAEMRP